MKPREESRSSLNNSKDRKSAALRVEILGKEVDGTSKTRVFHQEENGTMDSRYCRGQPFQAK
jgi:peptide methionine sulfoxide reductase MsrB